MNIEIFKDKEKEKSQIFSENSRLLCNKTCFKKGRIIGHEYLWRLKIDCQNLSCRITYNLFRYLPLCEVEFTSCPFSSWSLNGLTDSTKVESRE